MTGRTPHGVRGLKFLSSGYHLFSNTSHPAWGAWIEINNCIIAKQSKLRSTPHGVRGLKLQICKIRYTL